MLFGHEPTGLPLSPKKGYSIGLRARSWLERLAARSIRPEPNMRLLLALALLVASPCLLASESCFSRVAHMLAEGDLSALAQRVVSSTPDTAAGFRSLTGMTGPLSRLQAGKPAGFPTTFQRLTVLSPAVSDKFESRKLDFSASSESLGAVRIEIHLHPGLECAMLAVNVDFAVQPSKQ
jgi:hypothetical protein